jgi:hypothetical protein
MHWHKWSKWVNITNSRHEYLQRKICLKCSKEKIRWMNVY